MARSINQLYRDIERLVNSIGQEEGTIICEDVLNEFENNVPVDKARLVDSGFGYVDGILVATTDKGRNESSFGIEEPQQEGFGYVQGVKRITIKFFTPKPATPNATVFTYYGGRKIFDYAEFVLTKAFKEAQVKTFIASGLVISRGRIKELINRKCREILSGN